MLIDNSKTTGVRTAVTSGVVLTRVIW